MTTTTDYTRPPFGLGPANGGRFANINRPIAGAHEKDLPVGKHPLQLYSLATPNGVSDSDVGGVAAPGHTGGVRRG